jgi:NAD(P)-dependent dehydrogenase (short-subunit alcohol dehydrogenase family)
MSAMLSGRVAVVTGASRGLGREIACALAEHGASLALVARDRTGLEETAYRIANETGASARVLSANVTSPGEVEAVREAVEHGLGTAQILINAAGIFGPLATIRDGDPAEWIRTIAVDLVGPYLTCREFVNGMLETGWGRIVNVSSAASLYAPGPLNSAYSTAKTALNRMTRHLASEIAGSGITANVIHPGSLRTDMWCEIKQKVAAAPDAVALRDWADMVERTGGDPVEKATGLVLSLLDDSSEDINGRFCWPEAALEPPIESW